VERALGRRSSAHGGAGLPAEQRLRDRLRRPRAVLRTDGSSGEQTELEDAA
jgi:hypothetical protein